MSSRRVVVLGLLVAAGATRAGRALAARAKVSKAKALYQDQPKGVQSCAACAQFEVPDRCKTVLGKVSPHGWCMLYELAD